MDRVFEFSSESVAAGHPDKIADQISDAILDALLKLDSDARTAVETLIASADQIILAGEILSPQTARIDIEKEVRDSLRRLGYDEPWKGCHWQKVKILNLLRNQSLDIQRGIASGGAGDQGMMFGYASRETETLMPLPIHLARTLTQAYQKITKIHPLLGNDAKAQVTVRYHKHQPAAVTRILMSVHHHPDFSLNDLRDYIREELILTAIPDELRDKKCIIQVNPGGNFNIGGPAADTGLTGRKIIADTYGGMAPHGGGAFSGKDPSKVDRSAALMARYMARQMVKSGYSERATIQIAYAFGKSEPESLHIDFHGTGQIPESEAIARIRRDYDLSPEGIINFLNLKQAIYEDCARNGHFGRPDSGLSWER